MAKRPQAAHIIKDNPTEPERCKTPPGLMKIPDPSAKKNKIGFISELYDLICI